MQQNQRYRLFLIPHIRLSCQKLLPILPTVQLNRRQFDQRFKGLFICRRGVSQNATTIYGGEWRAEM